MGATKTKTKNEDELIRLDSIELAEDQALLGEFPAVVRDEPALVTAVLERTVVVLYEGASEKVLVRKTDVKVKRKDVNIVNVKPRQGVGRPKSAAPPPTGTPDPPSPTSPGGSTEDPAA